MDDTDDREKKKQGCQISILALAAIEQVWMVLTMGGPSPHVRNTRHRMEVPVLLHQKSDATSTCFGFWLKEEEAPFLPTPKAYEEGLAPSPLP